MAAILTYCSLETGSRKDSTGTSTCINLLRLQGVSFSFLQPVPDEEVNYPLSLPLTCTTSPQD